MSKYKKLWQEGFGAIKHNKKTIENVENILASIKKEKITGDNKDPYKLLYAADRIANFAMWLCVHQTYANNVYLDGRKLTEQDFKKDPQGHLGGALNMVPAYVGYLLANSLTGITRSWVIEQGHAVAAIDSVNLIIDNMTSAHKKRYSLTDKGMTAFTRDFYSYKIDKSGKQESPLGSHVNAHTAGGVMEGGYLGFAGLEYVHMPLPGENLVAFLSDGAAEEQKGTDWAPRWWRAEDSGMVAPIMIFNGRRIDQRSTIDQEGGAKWYAKYLALHDFDPIIFDGRDPIAFAVTIIEQELRLKQNVAKIDNIKNYNIKIPYGIAVAPKGAGFFNEGTNYAHNLPLMDNPSKNPTAAKRFNEYVKKLFVNKEELSESIKLFQGHKASKRVQEKDHPLANRQVKLKRVPKTHARDVAKNRESQKNWLMESPMDAIDRQFVRVLKANEHLRPRVGNPDEMSSNKMDDALNYLKFRVTNAEHDQPESTLGKVITALNEEAVAAAAFGNKGGINMVVTYEAFAPKMSGLVRQEIIFAKHKKELTKAPGWLSVPVVVTSNSWENSKNELSHQDPAFAETMINESADISRVFFVADYNCSAAVVNEIYQTQGQVWTLVVAKQNSPLLFTEKEASQLVKDGAIRIKWAENKASKAKTALVAIGSYQLVEVLKAAEELKKKDKAFIVSYIAEPGRFRNARNEGEKAHLAKEKTIKEIMPSHIKDVVMVTHTRPEVLVGMLQKTLLLGKNINDLGFINEGGTLNVDGMMQVNKCSDRDILKLLAKLSLIASK